MNLGPMLTNFFDVVKADAEKAVLPLVQGFVNNVASNPTELNLAAQGIAFLNGLLSAGITVEQEAIQAAAQAISAEVSTILAKYTTAAPAAPK